MGVMKNEYLSKEQFCREFHVGKRTALWLISNGLLPAIDTKRKTDRYLIARKDIARYLKKRELEPDKYRYRGLQTTVLSSKSADKLRSAFFKIWADIPDVLRRHDVETLLGYEERIIVRWRHELGLESLKISQTIYYPKKMLIDFLLGPKAQAQYPKSPEHIQLMRRVTICANIEL